MTKSREIKSDLVKGQAPSPYSNAGKHLLLINWRVTSSEAMRPTFAKIALTSLHKLNCSTKYYTVNSELFSVTVFLLSFIKPCIKLHFCLLVYI